MNPKDAAQRSLGHGIDVRIWNDRGEVILPLEVTDDVPPGVVASENGAWLSTSRTGQTISALVSADLGADLAEGACLSIAITVEPRVPMAPPRSTSGAPCQSPEPNLRPAEGDLGRPQPSGQNAAPGL
jgi:anaerobic selenocysteine-containing dehydrogenase